MLVHLEPSLALVRYKSMTHSTRKHLIKFLAPIALAIVMTFSGPVIHLARLTAGPEPQSTNVTIIYKQQEAPAAHVQFVPGKAALAG